MTESKPNTEPLVFPSARMTTLGKCVAGELIATQYGKNWGYALVVPVHRDAPVKLMYLQKVAGRNGLMCADGYDDDIVMSLGANYEFNVDVHQTMLEPFETGTIVSGAAYLIGNDWQLLFVDKKSDIVRLYSIAKRGIISNRSDLLRSPFKKWSLRVVSGMGIYQNVVSHTA